MLLVWVCLVSPVRAQLLSPGPLAKAHASLEGDGKCQRCHASGSQVVEKSCIDCHRDIGRERQSATGLHGRKFANKPCAGCHVEHLGKDVSLIRWPGTDPKRFDHDQTGWPLKDAHAKTSCTKCHDKRNERNVPTYLGVDARCGSCHKDPHEKRFGERCADCHDAVSFEHLDLHGFDHDLARFPLEGAHQKAECAGCHGRPPQYTKLDFADCGDCHNDPHQGRYRAACKSCHEASSWEHIVMPRAQHPGLSLAAGHQRTECASCHDAGLTAPPSRGSLCVSCHAAVHEAPFGKNCEQCHSSIRWLGLPESIGRSAHERTPFPLRGEHARASCEGCHRPELPRAARYRSLEFDKCASCHQDVHAGTMAEHGDCARCHDPLGFAPSLVQPTIHASFGFALEGNHAAAPCRACHEHTTTGTSTRRTHWENADTQCNDCHENPHGTQFSVEMSSGGCAHCHTPKGWGAAQFDHKSWPLTGAHTNAACGACHAATPTDQKAGRGASYRGAPRDCEGCHDDVHAGQFRGSDPVRACDFCHQTDQFALPAFEHARLTSYTLEGKHREAKCASCHPSTHLRNGDEVTRYRLGYQKCADCHADPHSVPEARR